MAKLQKIRNAGYKAVSNWRRKFRISQFENPGLESELSAHHYFNKYQLIFAMPCSHRNSKTYYTDKQRRNLLCRCYQPVPLQL